MTELLAVLLSFPTVLFSGLTALSLIYWLFVVLGALDIDTLGGAAGASKGALEGAMKGALEGAHVDGAADGLADGVDGVHEGAADGAADGADLDAGDGHGGAGFLSFLNLRAAPVTVVISLFALFGLTMTGMYGLTFGVPSVLLGLPLLFGASIVSLLLTSLAIRPLAPAFAHKSGTKSRDLIGKIAKVSTGKVTPSFGQAELDEGGNALILQIRDDGGSLARGDRVVLTHFDEASGTFTVEKLPDVDSRRPTGVRVSAEGDDPGADPEPRRMQR